MPKTEGRRAQFEVQIMDRGHDRTGGSPRNGAVGGEQDVDPGRGEGAGEKPLFPGQAKPRLHGSWHNRDLSAGRRNSAAQLQTLRQEEPPIDVGASRVEVWKDRLQIAAQPSSRLQQRTGIDANAKRAREWHRFTLSHIESPVASPRVGDNRRRTRTMAKPSNRFLRRALYVLGRLRERKTFTFRGASFQVHEGVLNPTAFRASFLFAHEALRQAPQTPARVLELGCGCGLAAVLLARAGHEVTAVDIDDRAVVNTQSNAERNHLGLRSLVSDWDAALGADERFDFIVMNPPFLTEEPPAFRCALYAGPGLEFVETGLRAARRRLATAGRVLVLTSDRTGRESFLATVHHAGLRRIGTTQNRQWFDTYFADVLEAE